MQILCSLPLRAVPLCALLALGACQVGEEILLGTLPVGDSGSGGAGADDSDEGGGGLENCTLPEPIHDYSFTGSGTELLDLQDGPPGKIRGGAALDASGALTLDGEDDYVDLPNGLLADRTAITVVLELVNEPANPAYVRFFDFGMGSNGEDPLEGVPTVGTSYLSLTPRTGLSPSGLAGLISSEGAPAEDAVATDVTLDDLPHRLALSVGPGRLRLFVDGAQQGEAPHNIALAGIDDRNNWLGRSQYDADGYFRGTVSGLRIYGTALNGCQLEQLER